MQLKWELLPGDGRQGEGSGWERLQSIRRRLQEKRRWQEKENEVERMTAMQDEEGKEGSGRLLDELGGKLRRAESVRERGSKEDFKMRQGRDFEIRQGNNFEMRQGKDFGMRQRKDFEMRQGKDFEMRQRREGRQLMRSTSLTAPLTQPPAFPRSSDSFQTLDMQLLPKPTTKK